MAIFWVEFQMLRIIIQDPASDDKSVKFPSKCDRYQSGLRICAISAKSGGKEKRVSILVGLGGNQS